MNCFRWHTPGDSTRDLTGYEGFDEIVMKQYLDIATLAGRLQVKRSTLYAWAEQGSIPHLKLGRLLRFDPDEIEDLAEISSARTLFNQRFHGTTGRE